jgi:voltage-gated potassium channel
MQAETGAQRDRTRRALRRQRWQLLARLHRALDPVFIVLSAIWLILVVIELATGALPRSLEIVVWVIWGLFVAEFLAGLLIAPARSLYLRKRWLTALSLVLPAFRIIRVASLLRFVSAARLARSVGLLRVFTSINRGLAALGQTARRRGVAYVIAATAIVLLVGSAGMSFFEGPAAAANVGAAEPSTGLSAYANALWWTAYAMSTGAPSVPTTGEGRLLGWLLSIYGLAVFGYLTAILASHFVGRDVAVAPVIARPGAGGRSSTGPG